MPWICECDRTGKKKKRKNDKILYSSCTNYYLVLAIIIDIVCFSESYLYIIMVNINLEIFTMYLHAKSFLFSVS